MTADLLGKVIRRFGSRNLVPVKLSRLEVRREFKSGLAAYAFHHAQDQHRFAATIETALRDIEIYPGDPGGVLEVDDAFFMPGELCIYDRDGNRIEDSCVRRMPDLSWIKESMKPAVTIPADCDIYDRPIVYLSFLPNHWGHFLTEATSRLWAFRRYPELGMHDCFFGRAEFSNPDFVHFFQAFGIARDRVKSFDRPIRLRKCLIPLPSINLRKQVYSVHRDNFRTVTAALLGNDRLEISVQPVYLSRSRFPAGRVLRRERELESNLMERGVRVVHLQELSLAAQVRLFNAHRVFIGCWGSAFHNLLFANVPEAAETHMLVEGIPNTNYMMFDALLGNRTSYVQALFPTPGARQVWPHLDSFIDVPLVLRYLKNAGVFSGTASRNSWPDFRND